MSTLSCNKHNTADTEHWKRPKSFTLDTPQFVLWSERIEKDLVSVWSPPLWDQHQLNLISLGQGQKGQKGVFFIYSKNCLPNSLEQGYVISGFFIHQAEHAYVLWQSSGEEGAVDEKWVCRGGRGWKALLPPSWGHSSVSMCQWWNRSNVDVFPCPRGWAY